MSRNESALREPGALDGFPITETTGQTFYRAHSATNGPWWFSSSGGGRFDLQHPEGTCYLASDVGTAIRESVGPLLEDAQELSEKEASTRIISELDLPSGLAFADLGASRELSTTSDYPLARRWAAKLRSITFDGVHYGSRFTSAGTSNAWAVFGPAGAHPTRAVKTLAALTGAEACAVAGITVISNSEPVIIPTPGTAPPGPRRQSGQDG